MRAHVRLASGVLAALLLTACKGDTTTIVPPQVLLRIHNENALVRARMDELRVTIAVEEGGQFVTRPVSKFRAEALDPLWPVEIPIIPKGGRPASPSTRFEVVVEAVETDQTSELVLVQARAITSWFERGTRLLELHLEPCGDQDLGEICEDDSACHGPACLTCVAGACDRTPVLRLPPLEDAGAGGAGGGAAGSAGSADAGTDAGSTDADAGVDSGPPPPGPCNPNPCPDDRVCTVVGSGHRCDCPPGLQGPTCDEDIDECADGAVAACGEGAHDCTNTHGSYECTCLANYAGNGTQRCWLECATNNGGCGGAMCVEEDGTVSCGGDIDECLTPEQTVCTADFPCDNREDGGYYDCRGQFPEWPVIGLRGLDDYSLNSEHTTVTDSLTNLVWEHDVGISGATWAQARAYCEQAQIAGFSDWRLPTKAELESIVRHHVYPAIDDYWFHVTDVLWTSTSLAADPNLAWGIHVNTGMSGYYAKDGQRAARCVRGGGN